MCRAGHPFSHVIVFFFILYNDSQYLRDPLTCHVNYIFIVSLLPERWRSRHLRLLRRQILSTSWKMVWRRRRTRRWCGVVLVAVGGEGGAVRELGWGLHLHYWRITISSSIDPAFPSTGIDLTVTDIPVPGEPALHRRRAAALAMGPPRPGDAKQPLHNPVIMHCMCGSPRLPAVPAWRRRPGDRSNGCQDSGVPSSPARRRRRPGCIAGEPPRPGPWGWLASLHFHRTDHDRARIGPPYHQLNSSLERHTALLHSKSSRYQMPRHNTSLKHAWYAFIWILASFKRGGLCLWPNYISCLIWICKPNVLYYNSKWHFSEGKWGRQLSCTTQR
jgi:hypothetical protein